MPETWIPACLSSDLAPEDVTRFDHGDRTFAIYRTADDRYYATDGLCTHARVHLAGMALLVGTIAALALRLLGLSRALPVRRLAAHLLPWTAASLLLIVPSGLLMFLARAQELIGSPLFALKMTLIFVAAINAVAFHAGVFRGVAGWDVDAPPPWPARLPGGETARWPRAPAGRAAAPRPPGQSRQADRGRGRTGSWEKLRRRGGVWVTRITAWFRA